MFLCLITSLLQLFFGFLLPFYGSLRLISSKASISPPEAAKWLTYWLTLMAILKVWPYLNVFEIEFLDDILSLVKTFLIIFLVLPQTDGSSIVYQKLIANNEIAKKLVEQVKEGVKPLVEKVSGLLKA